MTEAKIIKPGSKQANIRPFFQIGDVSQPEPQVGVPERRGPHSATVDLIEQLAQRDAEIAGHKEALADTFARGEESGRALAEEEFEDDRQEALALLQESLEQSRDQFAGALKRLENNSVALAHEVVAKLVGDDVQAKRLLKAAIRHQVEQIDGSAILSIFVSRADFPDTREVSALEKLIASQKEKLMVRDDLGRGESQIKLNLGSLDVGLSRQWKQISDLLAEIEAGNAQSDA
jgi:flagellar biosynthesis/type III secretory pathway protein FliH